MSITYRLDDTIPEIAKNRPLDKETLIKQLSKTSSTPYEFKTLDIDLEKNLFRLHILANSDSTEDQELKLYVRNKVIDYLHQYSFNNK